MIPEDYKQPTRHERLQELNKFLQERVDRLEGDPVVQVSLRAGMIQEINAKQLRRGRNRRWAIAGAVIVIALAGAGFALSQKPSSNSEPPAQTQN